MPFRSLAEPEEIALLEAAFEHAWKIIESSGDMDPLRVPAQRERLAHIIMGVWAEGKVPKCQLALRATDLFFAGISEAEVPVRFLNRTPLVDD